MRDAIPPTRRQQSEHEQPSYLHHDGRPCRNADRLKDWRETQGQMEGDLEEEVEEMTAI